MKLLDVVLLSFGVALFFIGVHQSTIYGIKNSYWIFMISLVFILFLRYRLAIRKATIVTQTKETEVKKGKKQKSKS
jgi:hypothetical protein